MVVQWFKRAAKGFREVLLLLLLLLLLLPLSVGGLLTLPSLLSWAALSVVL